MEDAFGRYATADAEAQSITAEMDRQFVAIREQYADRLAELEGQKREAFEVMQVFATEQREVLFTKRRSLETTHGIIGFRTGTPKLKNRKGFTWAAVLELVKTFLPKYIRLTEEIARDKMLADRDRGGHGGAVHQVRRLCRSGRGVLCRTQKGEGGLGRMEKTREYRRTTVELCRNCGRSGLCCRGVRLRT